MMAPQKVMGVAIGAGSDGWSCYASVSCIRVGSLGRANSESTCVLGERVIPWSTLSKIGVLAIFKEAIRELVATR